ncbi:MAG: DUF2267 domain-containing protein [Gracilimonas sp.]|uniref:DUF2267 domain-containing protein n=1 Tax=Gracilimonas sp. TaxID=1974203 RepID=UPI001989CD04|nr:DUF2267 domain-containing protein [Gracilimonas sp.]MBD3616325.1 DUF2267 domain-containing protein [Gracilimonas sp.]
MEKEVKWFEKLLPEIKTEKTATRPEVISQPKNLFNGYVLDASNWVNRLANELSLEKRKDVAWNILREVMHVIRDRITIEEVHHLSAQLPTLIRGMFLEGYSVSGFPKKFHVAELEERINEVLKGAGDIQANEAFSAVLKILYERVSEGELSDIRGTLPKDIRAYWDECLKDQIILNGERDE